MNIGASTPFKLVKPGKFIVDYVLLENTKERLVIEVITNLDLTPFLTGGNIKTTLYSIDDTEIANVVLTAPITISQRNNIIDNRYATPLSATSTTVDYNPTPSIGKMTDYTYNITDPTMNDNSVDFKFNIKYLLKNSYQVTFSNLSLVEGSEIYIDAVLSTYLSEPDVKLTVFESDTHYARKTRKIQKGNVVDISNGYINTIKTYEYGISNKPLDFFYGISYFDYTYSYSSIATNITTVISPETSNIIQTSNWGMYSDGNINDIVTLFLTNSNGFKSKVCNLTLKVPSIYELFEYTPDPRIPDNAFRMRRNCDYNGVNYYNNVAPNGDSSSIYYYPIGREKYRWSTDFTRKRNYEYYYEKIIDDVKTLEDYDHVFRYPSYVDDDNITYPSGSVSLNFYTLNNNFYDDFIDTNTASAPITTLYRRPVNSAFIGITLLKSMLTLNQYGLDMDTINTKDNRLMINGVAKNLDDISMKQHSYSGPSWIFNNSSIIDDNTKNNHLPLSKWKASNGGVFLRSFYSWLNPFDVDYDMVEIPYQIDYYNGSLDDGVGATIKSKSNGVLVFSGISNNNFGYEITCNNTHVGKTILVNFTQSNALSLMNGIYIITDVGSPTTKFILTRHISHVANIDIIGSIVRVAQTTVSYVNSKSGAVLGKAPFVYTKVSAYDMRSTDNFERYYSKNHTTSNIYLSTSVYLNDCYNASIKDYPLMPVAISTNDIAKNIPNVFDIADNPNNIKYLLEFETGSNLDTINTDNIKVGKTTVNTQFNSTVVYSNFLVKRQNYLAYYDITGVTYQGYTDSVYTIPSSIRFDAELTAPNGVSKYNFHRAYGSYRMTSGIESLGFVQKANNTTQVQLYEKNGKNNTGVLIPFVWEDRTFGTDTYYNNLLYYNNTYYFEQVYRNIIKVPIFNTSSEVYMKNIEIKSLDVNYTINVVSFISSTVDDSNDTFMYEYMIKVDINYNQMISGSIFIDYATSRLKDQSEYFVEAEYTLVFADNTGKEIRLKVKDINIP